jgi:hypothetical protein
MTGIRLGICVVALLLVSGCNGDGGGSEDASVSDDEGSQPESITVAGSLKTLGGADELPDGGCEGNAFVGFDDLAEGAAVTVTDSSGSKVALGMLDAGRLANLPRGYEPPLGLRKACQFPFIINDVPAGDPVYSLEISNRGSVDFSPEDSESLELFIESDLGATSPETIVATVPR